MADPSQYVLVAIFNELQHHGGPIALSTARTVLVTRFESLTLEELTLHGLADLKQKVVDLWRVLLLSGADTFGLSKLMSCMMNWFAPFTEHLKTKERMELMLEEVVDVSFLTSSTDEDSRRDLVLAGEILRRHPPSGARAARGHRARRTHGRPSRNARS